MYKKVYNLILLSLKKPLNIGKILFGTLVDDVHHIQEQHKSDQNDFIGHVNKNHKMNLVPLCKKHHKRVHEGKITINGFVTTSKGLELHYTNLEG